jgi:transcription elongation factor Elf1
MQYGHCPVCNGTKTVLSTEHSQDSETMDCVNCGGQYMYSCPSGWVRLNRSGQPCVHNYTSKNIGRSWTEYTCTECGDRYDIDSSD